MTTNGSESHRPIAQLLHVWSTRAEDCINATADHLTNSPAQLADYRSVSWPAPVLSTWDADARAHMLCTRHFTAQERPEALYLDYAKPVNCLNRRKVLQFGDDG